jgi:hypothetical protein
MIRDCSYCGNRKQDCLVLPILSVICPECFVRFFEYWSRRQSDLLKIYVQLKPQFENVKPLQ